MKINATNSVEQIQWILTDTADDFHVNPMNHVVCKFFQQLDPTKRMILVTCFRVATSLSVNVIRSSHCWGPQLIGDSIVISATEHCTSLSHFNRKNISYYSPQWIVRHKSITCQYFRSFLLSSVHVQVQSISTTRCIHKACCRNSRNVRTYETRPVLFAMTQTASKMCTWAGVKHEGYSSSTEIKSFRETAHVHSDLRKICEKVHCTPGQSTQPTTERNMFDPLIRPSVLVKF